MNHLLQLTAPCKILASSNSPAATELLHYAGSLPCRACDSHATAPSPGYLSKAPSASARVTTAKAPSPSYMSKAASCKGGDYSYG